MGVGSLFRENANRQRSSKRNLVWDPTRPNGAARVFYSLVNIFIIESTPRARVVSTIKPLPAERVFQSIVGKRRVPFFQRSERFTSDHREKSLTQHFRPVRSRSRGFVRFRSREHLSWKSSFRRFTWFFPRPSFSYRPNPCLHNSFNCGYAPICILRCKRRPCLPTKPKSRKCFDFSPCGHSVTLVTIERSGLRPPIIYRYTSGRLMHGGAPNAVPASRIRRRRPFL